MSQQVLLASYPMLFRPNSRRACIVGWGSGVTVSEILNFPINTVTAVELEPAVIEAAKVFNRFTHEPEKNPRVKVEINDGAISCLPPHKSSTSSSPSHPIRGKSVSVISSLQNISNASKIV